MKQTLRLDECMKVAAACMSLLFSAVIACAPGTPEAMRPSPSHTPEASEAVEPSPPPPFHFIVTKPEAPEAAEPPLAPPSAGIVAEPGPPESPKPSPVPPFAFAGDEGAGRTKKFHVAHGPLKTGEKCISEKCHPHAEAKYVHAPVATTVCEICHGAIGSNPPFGLTKAPRDLCLDCHEQQKALYTQARFVHKPVEEKCTNCHGPHVSDTNKFLLATAQPALCFVNCHEKDNPELVAKIRNAKVIHKPVATGECSGCHAPHASNFKKLLKEGPQDILLCFTCHKEEVVEMRDAVFKHGPVRDGLCAPCHEPHGSASMKILKHFFVEKFYNPYDPKLYALCFECHKEDLVLDERTTALTDFRNGDLNLHYLHVHRKKGRTCMACHQAHAGSQECQIRRSTPFGTWKIPIEFTKTPTGGKCGASCHVAKEYDREKPFELMVDKATGEGKEAQ